jgi:hypothetical protein
MGMKFSLCVTSITYLKSRRENKEGNYRRLHSTYNDCKIITCSTLNENEVTLLVSVPGQEQSCHRVPVRVVKLDIAQGPLTVMSEPVFTDTKVVIYDP